MKFCYLLICTFFLAITNSVPDESEFNDHFNCVEAFEKNNSGDYVSAGWECCGFNGLGEKHCAPWAEWEKYEGKYRRCKTLPFSADGTSYTKPEDMIGSGFDLCCDNGNWVDDCGKCKSFYVWDFLTHDTMDTAATFETSWREDYLNQGLSNSDGYDNKVYPGGYIKGTLQEFNDPNVCIYIPKAAGKMIEIKVESEEAGERLCIGDLHDESTDRNNPGQNDACSDTHVQTCFGDADTTNDDVLGFAFYIFCDEGCQEGGGSGTVPLWLRARFSPSSWMDRGEEGNKLATENVEMWCEYVVRDYPAYDVYPSDISLVVAELNFTEDSASQILLTFVLSLLLLVL